MLRDSKSLTNDGHAILREIDVAHPAAKSMIELSRTQDEEVGDGTTSVIIIGTYILASNPQLLTLSSRRDTRLLVTPSRAKYPSCRHHPGIQSRTQRRSRNHFPNLHPGQHFVRVRDARPHQNLHWHKILLALVRPHVQSRLTSRTNRGSDGRGGEWIGRW